MNWCFSYPVYNFDRNSHNFSLRLYFTTITFTAKLDDSRFTKFSFHLYVARYMKYSAAMDRRFKNTRLNSLAKISGTFYLT